MLEGTFEIHGTSPIGLTLAVKNRLVDQFNLQPPQPKVTIEIVFEDDTNVEAACKELYWALVGLGLAV